MLGKVGADPEPVLDELFKAWFAPPAIRTITVHWAATDDRLAKLVRHVSEAERPPVAEIADRFH
jgi:hypothetical protein